MRNGRTALACVVVAIDLKHQHVFWPQTHASRFSRFNMIRQRKFLPPPLRLGLLLLTLALAGCASHSAKVATSARPFNFQTDTFAYANDLVWEYDFTSDHPTHWLRQPPSDYTHHCFVVARAARQFFDHARFAPDQPEVSDEACRRLIRAVVGRSSRRASAEAKRIVIPGFANLHSFSESKSRLLKAECGGAWQSYFQRGHWRIVFPFSRGHQAGVAQRFLDSLQHHRPPVVHVVRFPQLSINHALLLFDATESDAEIRFAVYDPNDPVRPLTLTYRRQERAFYFPANYYFSGGRVDAYEVYRNWIY